MLVQVGQISVSHMDELMDKLTLLGDITKLQSTGPASGDSHRISQLHLSGQKDGCRAENPALQGDIPSPPSPSGDLTTGCVTGHQQDR